MIAARLTGYLPRMRWYSSRASLENWMAIAPRLTRLAVALAADHVDHAERRDDVGHHQSLEQVAERRHAEEAGWPHAHAIGPAAAVADEVEAELAVGAFHGLIRLAGRDADAFHHDLEMVHQAFDRVVDVTLRRQREARIADHHRPRRHLLEALLGDAHRLLHLVKTN